MNLARKRRAEKMGLYALLGSIGLGFFLMFMAIFDPRTGYTPPSAPPEGEEAGSASIDRSVFSTAGRHVNMHDAESDEAIGSETGAVLSARRVLIPKIAPSLSPNFFNEQADLRPSPSFRGAQRNKDADKADEDEKQSTGWGWLADDIMTKRKDRESAEKQEKEKVEDDERLGIKDEESAGKTASEKGREEQHYFINPSFRADNIDGSFQRSVLNDDSVGGKNDQDRDRAANEQISLSEAENKNAADRATAEAAASVLEIRDPFARDETREIRFEESSWSFGQADESTRFQSDSRSSRVIDDAMNDASRISTPWSGYASDSIFNAGGGYTPRGIGSGGSDPVFSGSGVFGGDAMFSVSSPSIDGGYSSGGSSIALPSSASPLGTSGFDADRATPRALPW